MEGTQHALNNEEEKRKVCSGCHLDYPISCYSSAQLKRKGKRLCQECTAAKKQEQELQKKTTNGTKVKEDAEPESAAVSCCIQCRKAIRKAADVRHCKKCNKDYCGTGCMKAHYKGTCRIVATMPPPIEFGDDEPFTEETLEQGLLELVDYWTEPPPPREKTLPGADRIRHELRLKLLGRLPSLLYIARMYPYDRAFDWWSRHSAVCPPLLDAFFHLSELLLQDLPLAGSPLIHLHQQYTDTARRLLGFEFHEMKNDNTWYPKSTFGMPSRVIHRLALYAKHFCTYTHEENLLGNAKSYLDVEYPDHGLLPFASFKSDNDTWLMRCFVYLTLYDVNGREALALLPGSVPLQGTRHLMTVGTSAFVCAVVQDGRLQRQQGLLLSFGRPRFLHVDINNDNAVALDQGQSEAHSLWPVTGFTGNPANMFIRTNVRVRRLTDATLQGILNTGFLPPHSRELCQAELQRRKSPTQQHVLDQMKELFPKQFPTPQEENLFIPIPRLGIETELVELLLLEELADEAAAGDADSIRLIATIEEECQQPIQDVIHRQRTKLDQMLHDQKEQLRIHAEAVQRTELRKLKAAAQNTQAIHKKPEHGTAASPSTTSNAQSSSAAAAATSASVSTAANSVTSAIVAASSSSAVSPIGSVDNDTPAASAWTAACKSVKELLGQGRLKFRMVSKLLLDVLKKSPLQLSDVNQAGSHVVMHWKEKGIKPLTLVEWHGGRSKDSSVPRSYYTRLVQQLLEVQTQRIQSLVQEQQQPTK